MLYEKKMLILSGDGKGVVLIEKCATGVRFTLRTFDLPQTRGALKVGIVTRSAVFVRDLPSVDDPAATFSIDVGDISVLHFAVFDKALRLYGTNAKRMWESNLMDLLIKHDRPAPETSARPVPPALPPISTPPRSLPMPDGTGIPQSRLELYGDEALAESDFYTPLDMSARMQTVDNFLDTPRILDGLAPRITPHTKPVDLKETAAISDGAELDPPDENHARPDSVGEISAAVRAEQPTEQTNAAPVPKDPPVAPTETVSAAETPEPEIEPEHTSIENNVAQQGSEQTGSAVVVSAETIAENGSTADGGAVEAVTDEREVVAQDATATVASEKADAQEVAATVSVAQKEQPWEMTARYLRRRSARKPVEHKPRVKPINASEQVRRLRECAFFERTRNDIETLFNTASHDDTLKSLLPDIEWIKVEFDGRTISVGRGGNAFLCYAVAGEYEKTSPLGDEAQWLPRERTMPTGKGYWLIFQNLATGEIVKSN